MASIEIISETPITMVELKEKMDRIKKNHELGFRANKTFEYLEGFAKQKAKEIDDSKKKLRDLNIMRLKESQMAKIIDMQPKDIDSLKAVLMGESITLKQEDMQRVIECIKG